MDKANNLSNLPVFPVTSMVNHQDEPPFDFVFDYAYLFHTIYCKKSMKQSTHVLGKFYKKYGTFRKKSRSSERKVTVEGILVKMSVSNFKISAAQYSNCLKYRFTHCRVVLCLVHGFVERIAG